MSRHCWSRVGFPLLIAFAACGGPECVSGPLCDGGSDGGVTPVPTIVTLSPTSVSFSSLGEKQQLTPTVTDQDGRTMTGASVTWLSSLDPVVGVSSTGLVTAVSNGDATITATAGTASGTASVTVQQMVAEITVSPSAVVLGGIGATATVVASVADDGGSAMVNPTLTWSSADVSVVTIDIAGLVTAVAIGSTTMTVEAPSGVQAQFTASVTANPPVAVTTTSLPDGVEGRAYSETLTASGGDGIYSWGVTVDSLPTGLSLNMATGVIAGAPTVVGTSNFTVAVTSGDGQSASEALTITVIQTPVVFSEDFEDNQLDPRITIVTVGGFTSSPGIVDRTEFGSTKAFGFGRSTCGASCFFGNVTKLIITFSAPTHVSTISFRGNGIVR